jgi:hypothetical protein
MADVINYQPGQRTVDGKQVKTATISPTDIPIDQLLDEIAASGRTGSYFVPGFYGDDNELLDYYPSGGTTPPPSPPPPPPPPSTGTGGGSGQDPRGGNSATNGPATPGSYDPSGRPNDFLLNGKVTDPNGGVGDLGLDGLFDFGDGLDQWGAIDIGDTGQGLLDAAGALTPGWAGLGLSAADMLARGYNTSLSDEQRRALGVEPLDIGQWAGSLFGLNDYGDLSGNRTLANPDESGLGAAVTTGGLYDDGSLFGWGGPLGIFSDIRTAYTPEEARLHQIAQQNAAQTGTGGGSGNAAGNPGASPKTDEGPGGQVSGTPGGVTGGPSASGNHQGGVTGTGSGSQQAVQSGTQAPSTVPTTPKTSPSPSPSTSKQGQSTGSGSGSATKQQNSNEPAGATAMYRSDGTFLGYQYADGSYSNAAAATGSPAGGLTPGRSTESPGVQNASNGANPGADPKGNESGNGGFGGGGSASVSPKGGEYAQGGFIRQQGWQPMQNRPFTPGRRAPGGGDVHIHIHAGGARPRFAEGGRIGGDAPPNGGSPDWSPDARQGFADGGQVGGGPFGGRGLGRGRGDGQGDGGGDDQGQQGDRPQRGDGGWRGGQGGRGSWGGWWGGGRGQWGGGGQAGGGQGGQGGGQPGGVGWGGGAPHFAGGGPVGEGAVMPGGPDDQADQQAQQQGNIPDGTGNTPADSPPGSTVPDGQQDNQTIKVGNGEIQADEGEFIIRRDAATQYPPEVLDALNDPKLAPQLAEILGVVLQLEEGSEGAAGQGAADTDDQGQGQGGEPGDVPGGQPQGGADGMAYKKGGFIRQQHDTRRAPPPRQAPAARNPPAPSAKKGSAFSRMR